MADKKDERFRLLGLILSGICLVTSAFHILIAWTNSISIVQQRVLHLFLILGIYFLLCTQESLSNHRRNAVLYGGTALLTLILGIYFFINTMLPKLQQRGIRGTTDIDIMTGVLLMVIVLYIAWRTVGPALAILSFIFIGYAMLGPYMPEIIAHKGYTIPYITSYVAWTSESIFGSCIGACVSFVALYIIFGELLEKFGAGQFFIDVAYALTGRMKGGPAEAAVVSSALMGSINGSAVANVVTTGTFTIPLMKKVGYKAEFAGAVEAVASTGGQLLPPVMGAAAFVMADMTGIPYSKIIIAAIIPGLLYYLSLGISVYLEADKLGLRAEPAERLPQIKNVLKSGWYHAIPIVVLIFALLVMGYSANYSALFAIAALVLIGAIKTLKEQKRLPVKEVLEALIRAAKTTVPVSIACACAGIVIGIVSMTGIGVRFTSIVFQLSGGNLFMMLLMIMLACIVMGMGLPSTAAYIIAASIGAPALVSAGIPELAAHMFVFYFAIMSFITPPVAMSAYAASGIAESNAGKTGWQAFLLGLPGFFIPFVYAFHPALLIVNTPAGATLYITAMSIVAVAAASVAIIGWLRSSIPWWLRLALGASIFPMFSHTLLIALIGTIATILLLTYVWMRTKHAKAL